MNINTIKFIGQMVISMSVGTVVGNAVKATTPAAAGKLGKVFAAVGSAAIGGYLGEKVANSVIPTEDEVESNDEIIHEL